MQRRNLLRFIAVGAATPVLRGQQSAPTADQLKFFNPSQERLVDRLSDMIIPADAQSPGASGAAVSLFIDNLLAESSDEEQAAWTAGLAAVESEARSRFGGGFLASSPDEQDAILATMAGNETSPQNELQRFFAKIKRQTISGYYTSRVGLIEDLEYQGVMPMAGFEPCDHAEHGHAAEREQSKGQE